MKFTNDRAASDNYRQSTREQLVLDHRQKRCGNTKAACAKTITERQFNQQRGMCNTCWRSAAA